VSFSLSLVLICCFWICVEYELLGCLEKGSLSMVVILLLCLRKRVNGRKWCERKEIMQGRMGKPSLGLVRSIKQETERFDHNPIDQTRNKTIN
jgi:hypothetical protein